MRPKNSLLRMLRIQTFYRPVAAVEGWQQPGVNGLGIGLEPVGNVVGYPATSQDNTRDSAKGALKAAILLPS